MAALKGKLNNTAAPHPYLTEEKKDARNNNLKFKDIFLGNIIRTNSKLN